MRRTSTKSRRIGKLKPTQLRFKTLRDLDHRTSSAHRARSLVMSLTNDLGGETMVTSAQAQLVQRAAILSAFLEDAEVKWVGGEGIAIEAYLKATNVQRRVLLALGLDRRSKPVQSLQEYLTTNARDTDLDVAEAIE